MSLVRDQPGEPTKTTAHEGELNGFHIVTFLGFVSSSEEFNEGIAVIWYAKYIAILGLGLVGIMAGNWVTILWALFLIVIIRAGFPFGAAERKPRRASE